MTISYIDFIFTKLAGYFQGLRARSYKGDDGQLPANDLMFLLALGASAHVPSLVRSLVAELTSDESPHSPTTLLGFAGLSLARYRKVRRARARSG